MRRFLNSIVALASALCVCAVGDAALATAYTWNVTPGAINQTLTWSTTSNWNPSTDYPGHVGTTDTAVISNALPSAWPSGTDTVQLDVTGINMSTLTLTDATLNNGIIFRVSKSATLQTITTNLDSGTRSTWTIDAATTLNVNKIDTTQTGGNTFLAISGGSVSTSILALTPDGGGTATWNYVLNGSNQDFLSFTLDATAPTKIVMNRATGSAPTKFETRNSNILVGNSGGTQTWNISDGGSPLVWTTREVNAGEVENIIKATGNDVDMGIRTGGNASDGATIARSVTNDFGGNHNRLLFTHSDGSESGGTVTVAGYNFVQTHQGTNPFLGFDKLGANLTISSTSSAHTNGGGELQFTPTNNASENSVSELWVLPGNTVAVQGANGDIRINDQFAAGTSTGVAGGSTMPGRMGIYFSGSTLTAGGSLLLLGPNTSNSSNTFLNDGTGTAEETTAHMLASRINVANNVTVRSTNAAGFVTAGTGTGQLANTTATPGNTINADDFDLRSTLLTMNGGGASKTLEWKTDAVAKGGVGLVAGDFTSMSDFVLGGLLITNLTAVTLTNGSVLYLDNAQQINGAINIPLAIDIGSTLTMSATGEINIQDPTNVDVGAIIAHIARGRLLNAHVVITPGVGETILSGAPEPASLALVVVGALALLRPESRRAWAGVR